MPMSLLNRALSAVAALVTVAGAAVAVAPTSIASTPHANPDAVGRAAGYVPVDSCPSASPVQHGAECFAQRLVDENTGAPVAPSFALRTGVVGKVSPAAAPAAAGGYSPNQLQSAYNIATEATSSGVGQRVYIIDAYDDPTAESDLQTYRAQFNLPVCNTANGCFQKLNQNGATSPLPSGDTHWAGEESLDLDMVSAICPNCTITLMEASDNAGGLYTAAQKAVSLGAKFVSMSFGSPEYSGETYYDSTAFNTPGVVFTASTGDNGYGTSYPAASPNVVAVGGTSLSSAANARGWNETAWTGAGGGCSSVEAQPSFQNGVIPSGAHCANRGDADVSAVADPYTGVAVYQTYGGSGWTVFGGTSASAPIIAATYALAGTPASTDRPASYLYLRAATGFNDVTSGSDGSCGSTAMCTATTGWDGPTGLGTPNGLKAFTTPNANTLTLTDPGNQNTGVNEAATLQLHMSDSDPNAVLKYTATGLPTGLSLNATTGIISGKATKLGTSNVAVRVSDDSGASDGAAFTWTVSTLGGTLSTGSKAIPGLSSVVTLTPNVPSSDTLTKVTWRASRSDCAITDSAGHPVAATATSVTITCAATSSATTTVTATITDSAAKTVTVSTPLTFDTSTGTRQVDVETTIDGQAIPTFSPTVCSNHIAAITTTAYDVATGEPIRGLVEYVTAKSAKTTTASALTHASTSSSGQATATSVLAANTTYTVSTHAQTAYMASTPVSTTVTPMTCTPTVRNAALSNNNVWYGDTVTVSGTLTRDSGNAAGPVAIAAASVPVTLTVPASGKTPAHTTTIARATTATDGTTTFSTTFKATTSGDVKIAIPAGSGLSATTVDLGTLTVNTPTTTITGQADVTDVGYGTPITVTGTLTSSKNGQTPLASTSVNVTIAAPGKTASTLTSGRTDINGKFSIKVPLTKSGVLAVTYAGTAGLPAATHSIGTVTAGNWTPTLTLNASSTDVIGGTAITFSGTATKSYGGVSANASGTLVRIYLHPTAGGPQVLLGSTSVPANGTFTVRATPKATGTVTANMTNVLGYADAASPPVSITIGSATSSITLNTPTSSVRAGQPVSFTGTVTTTYEGATAPGKGVSVRVYLQPTAGGVQVYLGGAVVAANGTYTVRGYPRVSGNVYAQVIAGAGYGASTSTQSAISVT